MKSGDFIRVVLSCGIREEGIIFNSKYVDEDGDVWIILRHKDNPKAELYICKKYIAAHQVDNSEKIPIENEIQTIVVEDYSTNELIKDPKIRIQKIAESKIAKGNLERDQFKKIMANKNINRNKQLNYSLPTFLK